LWTLPPNDKEFSTRLRLIKTYVTKHYREELEIDRSISQSRQKREEGNLWQRRFWEHLIRDEQDFTIHCDYIHNNPVKHGLCSNPQDWQFSSIHRFIAQLGWCVTLSLTHPTFAGKISDLILFGWIGHRDFATLFL
jgi:putative transposase